MTWPLDGGGDGEGLDHHSMQLIVLSRSLEVYSYGLPCFYNIIIAGTGSRAPSNSLDDGTHRHTSPQNHTLTLRVQSSKFNMFTSNLQLQYMVLLNCFTFCFTLTLNLSRYADSISDKKKYILIIFKKKNYMSHVTCQLSPATGHMSLTPTATATDPPPANSPTMHSSMVSTNQIINRTATLAPFLAKNCKF